MIEKYFIADYHIADILVSLYENRPNYSLNELIAKVNSVVKKEDIIYFLGDMCTKEFAETGLSAFLKKINGIKILIMGNHDKDISTSIKYWLDKGFDEVYKDPVVVDGFFVCSHEPMYMNANSPYVNIFGHVHNNQIYRTESSCGYCVCVERNDFTPVSMKIIKEAIGRCRLN